MPDQTGDVGGDLAPAGTGRGRQVSRRGVLLSIAGVVVGLGTVAACSEGGSEPPRVSTGSGRQPLTGAGTSGPAASDQPLSVAQASAFAAGSSGAAPPTARPVEPGGAGPVSTGPGSTGPGVEVSSARATTAPGPSAATPGGQSRTTTPPVNSGTQHPSTPAAPSGPTISTSVAPLPGQWRAPIYDLDDYLSHYPHTHFGSRAVMLTIDDGPSPEWTPRYLRLLGRYDIKATFNLIGEQVPANRTLVRAMASEGHVLANHTWTHDEQLASRAPERIRREIQQTNDAIHTAAGRAPTQFRAPGGNWGPAVFAELARQNMLPLDWDVDPRDWARPGVPAIRTAMLQARPHDIILCHDGGGDRAQTYRALQLVLPELRHRGYTFTTLPARTGGHRTRQG